MPVWRRMLPREDETGPSPNGIRYILEAHILPKIHSPPPPLLSLKDAALIVPVLAVLARLAQLLFELFIKRSAYTKVMGIHNIQK